MLPRTLCIFPNVSVSPYCRLYYIMYDMRPESLSSNVEVVAQGKFKGSNILLLLHLAAISSRASSTSAPSTRDTKKKTEGGVQWHSFQGAGRFWDFEAVSLHLPSLLRWSKPASLLSKSDCSKTLAKMLPYKILL